MQAKNRSLATAADERASANTSETHEQALINDESEQKRRTYQIKEEPIMGSRSISRNGWDIPKAASSTTLAELFSNINTSEIDFLKYGTKHKLGNISADNAKAIFGSREIVESLDLVKDPLYIE